ncbi:MAG TPA: ribokinase [Anaerolineales bacterium]
MTGSILVVGSINMDLVVRSPHLPLPGETILGSQFNTFPGGKGANQAVAAARLGAPVKMIGRVGKDAFGEAMLQALRRDGVDVAAIGSDPEAPTGVALITVDDAGQNTIVVASGANMLLSPENVVQAEALFEAAALLVLQLEIAPPVIEQACLLARRHGVRILLNPAPARPLPAELLRGIDLLIPNQIELALLAQEQDPSLAARKLVSWGVGQVIVTLGEDGALLVDSSQEIRAPACRVKAVDTTAAGDAFVGALAVALADGRSVPEAAAWANAAAAVSVTRAGAQPSLPRRDEVERMIREAQ